MKKGFLKMVAPLALVAAFGTASASAAPRGGFGGHAGGHAFSAPARGFGGRAYVAPRVYGGYARPGYYGPGFGFGLGVGVYPYAYAPYAYAPYAYAPYGYANPAPAPYAAPACTGNYDQNGVYQPSPGCAAPPAPYQGAPGPAAPYQGAPAPQGPDGTAPYGN
jgi:hypothetical protein